MLYKKRPAIAPVAPFSYNCGTKTNPCQVATMDNLHRVNARRVLIVSAVLGLVLFIGLAIAYTHYQARVGSRDYIAAMKSLQGQGRPQSMNEIEQTFRDIAANGDVRGNFGVACVMYKRRPDARLKSIEILRPAAEAGFLPAQAALLARYAKYGDEANLESDQTAAQQLLFQLLQAAEGGEFSQLDDPSLPPDGEIKRDTAAYVWKILRKGECAPDMYDEEIERVLKKSNSYVTRPLLRLPDPK